MERDKQRSKVSLYAAIGLLGLVAPWAFALAEPVDIQLHKKALENGRLQMITIRGIDAIPAEDRVPARWAVKVGDRDVPFFEVPEVGNGAIRALFAVPFGQEPGIQKVVLSGPGQLVREIQFEVVDGKYASEVLKVDPKFTKLSPKVEARIKRESRLVGAIYERSEQRRYWKGPFVLPIKSRVTSQFGNKRMFNGELKSFHSGLDLQAPVATPVRAPAAGKVVLTKALFLTGKTVILDHGYGLFTSYAHLNSTRVKVGQVVAQGKILGLSGMTGRASGPHLHWGAIVHHSKINPVDLVEELR